MILIQYVAHDEDQLREYFVCDLISLRDAALKGKLPFDPYRDRVLLIKEGPETLYRRDPCHDGPFDVMRFLSDESLLRYGSVEHVCTARAQNDPDVAAGAVPVIRIRLIPTRKPVDAQPKPVRVAKPAHTPPLGQTLFQLDDRYAIRMMCVPYSTLNGDPDATPGRVWLRFADYLEDNGPVDGGDPPQFGFSVVDMETGQTPPGCRPWCGNVQSAFCDYRQLRRAIDERVAADQGREDT